MKTVLLFGSPNSDRYTAALTERYIRTLPEENVIVRYNAYEIMAQPCFGCGMCGQADVCQSDDLDALFEDVRQCDLLIIASPVYYLSFPAPLKAIIDRMQRFHEASKRGENRMESTARQITVLLAAGAPSEKGEVISRQLRWIARTLEAEKTQLIVMPDTDRIPLAQAAEEADRLIGECIAEEK